MKFIFLTCIILVLPITLYPYGRKKANSIIYLNKTNLSNFEYVHIERDGKIYYEDSIGLENDTIALHLKEPIGVTVFINNDVTTINNIYLENGKYTLKINVENKKVELIGSKINDEYHEKMRVYDSLIQLYKLPKGLHPMVKDFEVKKKLMMKYMPFIDSLSSIHIDKFYKNNRSSFLTLEHIYFELENPKYHKLEEREKLKKEFEKLNRSLRKYEMYKKCKAFFKQKIIEKGEINQPLFKSE